MVVTPVLQAGYALFRSVAAGQFAAAVANGARYFSSAAPGSELKSVLAAKIPGEQERLKRIKKTHGQKELAKVVVEQVIGGMRGIPGMLWETSLLDPEEGIRFRGYSIPQIQATLPGATESGEPLPEGLLWLLLTGEVPTKAQVKSVTEELRARSQLPSHIKPLLETLPRDTHPMTQLVALVSAMQVSARGSQCIGLHAWEKGRKNIREGSKQAHQLNVVPGTVVCSIEPVLGHYPP
eukprot:GHRR01012698.1.p1 GENE.GHRR01012698.1~~GHRR01012698.1.p1  ORF type:complete len:237 (+),score=57.77 GHRR01012698.1:186-896(+)